MADAIREYERIVHSSGDHLFNRTVAAVLPIPNSAAPEAAIVHFTAGEVDVRSHFDEDSEPEEYTQVKYAPDPVMIGDRRAAAELMRHWQTAQAQNQPLRLHLQGLCAPGIPQDQALLMDEVLWIARDYPERWPVVDNRDKGLLSAAKEALLGSSAYCEVLGVEGIDDKNMHLRVSFGEEHHVTGERQGYLLRLPASLLDREPLLDRPITLRTGLLGTVEAGVRLADNTEARIKGSLDRSAPTYLPERGWQCKAVLIDSKRLELTHPTATGEIHLVVEPSRRFKYEMKQWSDRYGRSPFEVSLERSRFGFDLAECTITGPGGRQMECKVEAPEQTLVRERGKSLGAEREPPKSGPLSALWTRFTAKAESHSVGDIQKVYQPPYTPKPSADARSMDTVLRPPWQVKRGADAQTDRPRARPFEASRQDLPASISQPELPGAAVNKESPTVVPERIELKGFLAATPKLRTNGEIPYLKLQIGARELSIDGKPIGPASDKWHQITLLGKAAKEHAALQVGDEVAVSGSRLLSINRRGDKVSNIVDPSFKVLEKEMGQLVVARGSVQREPQLLSTPDGRVFARIMILADSLESRGPAALSKWQIGVFWDDAARDVLKVRKGDKVELSGQLTKVSWKQEGQQFDSFELRNAKCAPAPERQQALTKHKGKSEDFELSR